MTILSDTNSAGDANNEHDLVLWKVQQTDNKLIKKSAENK